MTSGRPDRPGASATLARRWCPERVRAGAERPIEVDQTNRSVVVDESVIVKWFVPPVPAPHPGVTVLEHLRAVGFGEVPELLGVETVDGSVVATVSVLVPDALDGWDWFTDTFLAFADGELDESDVLADATAIGAIGGRLTVALATPSAVLPRPTTVLGAEDLAAEQRRWWTLLDDALDAVAVLAPADPADPADERAGPTPDPRSVLLARVDAIRAVFAAGEQVADTIGGVVHGDLHVGQLLRPSPPRRRSDATVAVPAAGATAPDDGPAPLTVTDFDGNPLGDPRGRLDPRPTSLDAVSLVQSVDHTGRIAQRRRPAAAGRLEPVIERARQAALAAYRRELDRADRPELLDDRLVPALTVAQELHELVYAARHLPRWAYAPTATLTALFPHPETH